MTNFRFLKNVATIVACFAVMFFAGCDDDNDDDNGNGEGNGNDIVAVTEVALNRTTLTLVVDEKETLGATVLPETATNKDVSWSSDKPEFATVSQSGEVTAVAAGTAVITVKTADGDKTARCTVSVTGGTSNNDPFDIEMIFVQGGTFTMGSENSLDAGASPSHEVTLDSYSIGKYLVTQVQWLEIMGSWPGTAPSSTNGVGDNYPAYFVCWNDIVGTSSSEEGYTVNGITYYQNGFCYKLSQEAGDGRQYRLPTEAEWEYAARGGSQSQGYIYSGSNNIDEVAWYSSNSNGSAQPVGTKLPNELGIYDMSGNVWEWCGDRYSAYTSTAKTNPTGPTTGSNRVLRGGFWNYFPYHCRVARRDLNSPDFRAGYGFRLAFSSN